MRARQTGTALTVGLLLLTLITLLGLAGASSARVELQLAHNEQFRENAASAASAGIEIAIRHVTASEPETVPTRLFAAMARNAGNAADYFKLPANRVIELGTKVEI